MYREVEYLRSFGREEAEGFKVDQKVPFGSVVRLCRVRTLFCLCRLPQMAENIPLVLRGMGIGMETAAAGAVPIGTATAAVGAAPTRSGRSDLVSQVFCSISPLSRQSVVCGAYRREAV